MMIEEILKIACSAGMIVIGILFLAYITIKSGIFFSDRSIKRREKLQRKCLDEYQKAISSADQDKAYEMLKLCTKHCCGFDKDICLRDRFCDSCVWIKDPIDDSQDTMVDGIVYQHINSKISEYHDHYKEK